MPIESVRVRLLVDHAQGAAGTVIAVRPAQAAQLVRDALAEALDETPTAEAATSTPEIRNDLDLPPLETATGPKAPPKVIKPPVSPKPPTGRKKG